jgi:hypothetical protein
MAEVASLGLKKKSGRARRQNTLNHPPPPGQGVFIL